MRKALLALLAVGSLAAISTAATTTSAEAWGGCGPYRHPTPWGCAWNHRYYGGPVVVAPVFGFGYRPWGWGWHRRYW